MNATLIFLAVVEFVIAICASAIGCVNCCCSGSPDSRVIIRAHFNFFIAFISIPSLQSLRCSITGFNDILQSHILCIFLEYCQSDADTIFPIRTEWRSSSFDNLEWSSRTPWTANLPKSPLNHRPPAKTI